jgi:DNA-binding response OmpR family regulator
MAKILIADDDAHIARVMSIWLSRHGHTTLCVSNGRQALDLIKAQPVDMVISDMNMPEMDGLGFVKALREFAGDRLPVIVLSARCDQRELMDALSSYGVKVYPKPFLPSYIVAEIHRLLENADVTQAGGVS